MRKFRERLALLVCPWLERPAEPAAWINPAYYATSGVDTTVKWGNNTLIGNWWR